MLLKDWPPSLRGVALALLVAPMFVDASMLLTDEANTYVVTDEGGLGRRFDGIGALSGGGGTSIFLRDYPEAQRSLILDLLFKPSYGASLHMLKVEIGGDAQSTEAVEPSHMHSADDFNMQRGYEGWLLSEAKARNPALLSYGLAWAYPGWVGNGTGSPYGAPVLATDYLARWVTGMRDTWNVSINFLGQWNEKPPALDFILQLRAALDAAGLSSTGLVGSDRDWGLADAINNSSALRAALVALGAHYPASNTTPAALETGLPLWASEDFSDFNRGASHWGAQCWARTLNRNFAMANITAGIMWHLASALDERQWWYGASALNAPQPWSGYYEVTSVLWSFAHTTQFTAPGWRYLRHGAGSGGLAAGGSYVALTDSSRVQLTLVIEKIAFATSQCQHNGLPYDTADENATFVLGGAFSSVSMLHAWRTHYSDSDTVEPTLIFERQPPVRIISGTVSLLVRVGDVWTLSTVSTAAKAIIPAPPPAMPFPLPYASDFEAVVPPRPPPLWADQGGVFEAWASGDAAHGIVLRQSVPAHPICWAPRPLLGSPPRESADGIVPHTLLGDGRWTDVNVTTAFMIEPSGGADAATGTPGAMVGARASGNINTMSGVWLAVNATGAWNLSLGSANIALPGNQLASGACTPATPGSWHELSLAVRGGVAAGALDGVPLFAGIDVTAAGAASRAGWAALGTTDFGHVQFDNVRINATIIGADTGCEAATAPPLAPPVNVSAWRCADAAATAHGAFDWVAAPASNATLYGPTGQFILRGTAFGAELCLAVTTPGPDGWPLVQLTPCLPTDAAPSALWGQLWVVRADDHIMSATPWGQADGHWPCLTMGGDLWSFGAPVFAKIQDCSALSPSLFTWDAVSGAIMSAWLGDLCLAACASG